MEIFKVFSIFTEKQKSLIKTFNFFYILTLKTEILASITKYFFIGRNLSTLYKKSILYSFISFLYSSKTEISKIFLYLPKTEIRKNSFTYSSRKILHTIVS